MPPLERRGINYRAGSLAGGLSSYLFGKPLDLIFTPFEVAAVTISVLIVGLFQ